MSFSGITEHCHMSRDVRFGPKAGHWLAHLLAASVLFFGETPMPCGKPERIFPGSQPAIANEVVCIERRRLAASVLGTRSRSDVERRADACIDVTILEGLL